MSLVPNIKYKTEYCLYWQEGKLCEKGNFCFFAHGQQELRSIEEVLFFNPYVHTQASFIFPGLPRIISKSCQGALKKHRTRESRIITKPCSANFMLKLGQCKLGEKCTYAHQRREKKKKKASQEYKLDPNHPENFWEIHPNYEYYSPYYYQQFYQNYPNYPNYIPEDQNQMPLVQAQMKKENSELLNQTNEDIPISSQINKTITYFNQPQTKKQVQLLQSPEHTTKMSPNSAKTQSSAKAETPELRSSLISKQEI